MEDANKALSKDSSPFALENLLKTLPAPAVPTIAKQAVKERNNRKHNTFVSEAMLISKNADLSDVQTLYNCWSKYIGLCNQYGITATYSGCLLACGLQHATVNNWVTGKKRKNEPQYAEFAGKLIGFFNAMNDITANEGNAPPIHNLAEANRYFAAKADEAETSKVSDNDTTIDIDPEEIAKKYQNVLTEDIREVTENEC